MKRADAFEWCGTVGAVTARGFQFRVWPKARALAGLSERGAAGTKVEIVALNRYATFS